MNQVILEILLLNLAAVISGICDIKHCKRFLIALNPNVCDPTAEGCNSWRTQKNASSGWECHRQDIYGIIIWVSKHYILTFPKQAQYAGTTARCVWCDVAITITATTISGSEFYLEKELAGEIMQQVEQFPYIDEVYPSSAPHMFYNKTHRSPNKTNFWA